MAAINLDSDLHTLLMMQEMVVDPERCFRNTRNGSSSQRSESNHCEVAANLNVESLFLISKLSSVKEFRLIFMLLLMKL